MMLLYFFAADLPQEEAAALCIKLRRHGHMLCLPASDTDSVKLAALPFTAALLHYRQSPAGLPDPEMLHRCFPGLPIIALGAPPDTPARWRALPGADYELTLDTLHEELDPLLNFLHQKRGIIIPRHTSLYLPEDRRRVMVMTTRIPLSTDEFTLLRILAAAREPLPSTLLCCFNVNPGSTPSPKTVPFHVQRLKEKTAAEELPPLIRYVHLCGYTLAPPYDILLDE